MKRRRSKHLKAVRSRAYLKQAMVGAVIMISLFTTVANAAAFFGTTAPLRIESGRIRAVGTKGRMTVSRLGRRDTVFEVDLDAAVTKDGRSVTLGSLNSGDIVRVRYAPDGASRRKVVEVNATSLVVIGRISTINRQRSWLSLENTKGKKIEIGNQTIILWRGALADFADLKPGLVAKAEFDSFDRNKLLRLKIGY